MPPDHQIFLSYAREDFEKASTLAAALEQFGWSVFWDRKIRIGQRWHVSIEQKLKEALCILVLWSEHSRESEHVFDEADRGRNRLVPANLDGCELPLGYGRRETADLCQWDGSTPPPERLVEAVAAHVGSPPPAQTLSSVERSEGSDRPSEPDPHRGLFDFIETPKDGRVPLWANIPAGSFLMGPEDQPEKQKLINIEEPFRLMVVPVTQAMYALFDTTHLSWQPKGCQPSEMAFHPVTNVTCEDAKRFCERLARSQPRWVGARLPREEEWEYACRAGRNTAYWSGQGERDLDRVGWWRGNSKHRTHRVGERAANPFDLYDTTRQCLGMVPRRIQDHGRARITRWELGQLCIRGALRVSPQRETRAPELHHRLPCPLARPPELGGSKTRS